MCFFGIILYIAARFEFRFGVAAALSTFHDVLAVLGVLGLAARALTTEAFAWMAIATTLGWLIAVATDAGLQLHLAREVDAGGGKAGRGAKQQG